MAARLGKSSLDKKVEKATKQDLMAKFFKEFEEWQQATKDSPGSSSNTPERYQECRCVAMSALNFLAVKSDCYLGLTGESANGKDWAIKILANVIEFGEKNQSSLDLLRLLFPEDSKAELSKEDVADMLSKLIE